MGTTVLDRIVVRFYLGNDQDERLARYLAQFNAAPQGAKPDEAKRLMYLGLQVVKEERTILDRDAIRNAVREALGETQAALIDALASPDLDPTMVRRVVQEAIRDVVEELGIQEHSMPFDLSDIRKVVNAALQEQLGRLELSPVAQKPHDGNDDDDEAQEVEELMQKLDASLANFGGGIS
jgi:flagellar biosynthesis/type III secretory pathway protein FliH